MYAKSRDLEDIGRINGECMYIHSCMSTYTHERRIYKYVLGYVCIHIHIPIQKAPQRLFGFGVRPPLLARRTSERCVWTRDYV